MSLFKPIETSDPVPTLNSIASIVLIASLTTATYAWFTQSNKTTISGFDLQVVAGNALNIGLKKDLSKEYNPGDAATAFVTGTCTYAPGDAGKLGGSWNGDPGLSATLDHQILFGDMSKAVGFTEAATADGATTANTGLINKTAPAWQTIIKANQGSSSTVLAGVETATANGNIEKNQQGDFAYMWLGVSPAKTLSSVPKLHIYVQSIGGGNNLGIATAIHVAYKVNADADWTDVDAFADNYTKPKTEVTHTMEVDASDWFANATKGATIDGMTDVPIQLTKTNIGDIDQIQLVIYLAGSDPDCVDAAKGVQAKIGIYFEATEAEKSATPTAATINDSGILTMTGAGNGTTVEYSVDNGVTWKSVQGSWSTNEFTSSSVLTDAAGKGTAVQVRQKEANKLVSTAFAVTQNNYNG